MRSAVPTIAGCSTLFNDWVTGLTSNVRAHINNIFNQSRGMGAWWNWKDVRVIRITLISWWCLHFNVMEYNLSDRWPWGVKLFVHARNGHWTSGQNQVAERSSYGLHLPSCGDLRHIFAQFCQTSESIVYIVCWLMGDVNCLQHIISLEIYL
jgi:hypothetical protein